MYSSSKLPLDAIDRFLLPDLRETIAIVRQTECPKNVMMSSMSQGCVCRKRTQRPDKTRPANGELKRKSDVVFVISIKGCLSEKRESSLSQLDGVAEPSVSALCRFRSRGGTHIMQSGEERHVKRAGATWWPLSLQLLLFQLGAGTPCPLFS
jgi:hypothetical protein